MQQVFGRLRGGAPGHNLERYLERSQKSELIEGLKQVFSSVNIVVVTRPAGLTVGETTDLRRQMRAAGAGFRVTKNRLAKIALAGTAFEPLADMFVGPTAIAYSSDPIAAAKAAVEYAEKNQKLVIIGASFDRQVLNAAQVTTLAKLPSLDQLRGQLVGLLQAPATRIARVIQAPAGQVARVINAYATKEQKAA